MNCKPGDLAMIVRSKFGNSGKIVRCVRLHDDPLRDADGAFWIQGKQSKPRWVIDPPVPVLHYFLLTVADENMRPIRDSDGEDEMLRIAGKPQEVNA